MGCTSCNSIGYLLLEFRDGNALLGESILLRGFVSFLEDNEFNL